MHAYFGRRLDAINIVDAVAALTMTDAKTLMRGGRLLPWIRGNRDAAMLAIKQECFFNDAALAKWFKVSETTVKVSLARATHTDVRGYATRRLAHMAIGYLRGRLDEQEDLRRTAEAITKKGAA